LKSTTSLIETIKIRAGRAVDQGISRDSRTKAGTGLAARVREWTSRKLGWGAGGKKIAMSGRQAVKDSYYKKNGRLTELTRRKTDLEGKLNADFGPDDAFLTLADRCAEFLESSVEECRPSRSHFRRGYLALYYYEA
jgi:hypothetical protein